MTRRRALPALLAACLLGLGACGGGEGEETAAAPGPVAPTGATGPTAQAATG
ncbi:MAG: polysaccharide deacetylase family protein, partial [Solirubrobacterales bacterium]|nr:polysaccharide deacetylase family protein [Solirubrobacterales bacterium]